MAIFSPVNAVTDIIPQLEKIVGQDGVIKRKDELFTYECDGLTGYRQRPALVVLPRTTEQVATIVKLCHDRQIPWIARGAGTGLSGGALPGADSLLIVTTRMRQILAVDYDNQTIVVQPGVVNNWVTQTVSGAGFYYAPDPSSQIVCSIGGNIAENSGGVHCLKYGTTTNHVLGLKLVIPDGSIVEVGGQVPETPGYDLTGLFVGSEGTLGIATEITLKILKTPESICVVLADFLSLEATAQSVADIIAAGIVPAGMEIMDNFSINAVEDVVATNCYPRDAAAILLVELDGLPIEVELNQAKVEEICRNNGARNTAIAYDQETRLKMWKGRKAAFAAAGKLSPSYFVQDGVVPRTQLVQILSDINDLSKKYGFAIANVFHAGDGNLHPLILYDQKVPGAWEKVEELGGEILKRCVELGGSLSGEHGIGIDKNCFMPNMFNEVDLETMQWVRQCFNPDNLANPGKLFPTPRSCGEVANAQRLNLGQDKKMEEIY
ncbi:glycolate oxidase subunit; GlcD [Synechocystis sp. PCC 6803]|uniref:Glycolate oxidase subunit GlcD n=1 Tax=Synechocystis sp. (strain ATCC 27184 / PCC 6803 / Kazusa) TaxID=1111708 RepID=Q55124_SYNY3|nr:MULTISPECIES: glycolate oxidase subunit GlcD [unclassified Synechocystis]BAM54397.1 glycolate oxidase subunit GlcD [Synechocystis sp. PCC 6803] [Bacillus subtilis BEST7613]AGF52548.1 glycolate oxidase subunit GlcD [Synechocystis sp. PCC 6803]ALJ68475.1 glycolate oxidase subunit GlcD [Synechocystis sp. PCC 6803]AVP90317.1 glycolate oxidase subunit GlcD [Synechocystis sp. IPPAS B-1465]MBD2616947.1 glycolate oxidase subunit GlcD [Synechocystis sp. FACHB-898]